MADLRTDYVDDILDTSVNTNRKYRMLNNDDGTVSLVDETVYMQNGDTFGARDINAVTQNLTAENGASFNFAYNEETNEYGYMAKVEGADTFFPFSNAKKLYESLQYSGLVTPDMTFDEMCAKLAETYPATLSMICSGWVASKSNSSIPNATCSSNTSSVYHKTGAVSIKNNGAAYDYYYTSPEFDITPFTNLSVQGTAWSYRCVTYVSTLYLVSENGTKTEIYKQPARSTANDAHKNVTDNISKTFNVSNLKGKYRLQIAGHTNDYHAENTTSMTLTKALFSA